MSVLETWMMGAAGTATYLLYRSLFEEKSRIEDWASFVAAAIVCLLWPWLVVIAFYRSALILRQGSTRRR